MDNVQNPDGWGLPVSSSGFSFPAWGEMFKSLMGGFHMSVCFRTNEPVRGRWVGDQRLTRAAAPTTKDGRRNRATAATAGRKTHLGGSGVGGDGEN